MKTYFSDSYCHTNGFLFHFEVTKVKQSIIYLIWSSTLNLEVGCFDLFTVVSYCLFSKWTTVHEDMKGVHHRPWSVRWCDSNCWSCENKQSFPNISSKCLKVNSEFWVCFPNYMLHCDGTMSMTPFWKHVSKTSIQHHGSPQVVGVRLLLSLYVKVHCMNVQIYGGQGTVPSWIHMPNSASNVASAIKI